MSPSKDGLIIVLVIFVCGVFDMALHHPFDAGVAVTCGFGAAILQAIRERSK